MGFYRTPSKSAKSGEYLEGMLSDYVGGAKGKLKGPKSSSTRLVSALTCLQFAFAVYATFLLYYMSPAVDLSSKPDFSWATRIARQYWKDYIIQPNIVSHYQETLQFPAVFLPSQVCENEQIDFSQKKSNDLQMIQLKRELYDEKNCHMEAESQKLHVVLFPFMAHGHMIPTLDIARLFAARGVQATIITTRANAPTFTKAIKKQKTTGNPTINIESLRFPAQEVGLPEGCENLEQALGPDLLPKFFKASAMLREPLEEYLERTRPNCLVADMFFTWATESAVKFNIPRLVFHGTSYFALCVGEVLRLYSPQMNVSSDEEPFTLPVLPHEVRMTRMQLPDFMNGDLETDWSRRFKQIKESELGSYGVIVNSFYELEPDYADLFRKELGRRAWHIGPVSLICNRNIEDKAHRGKQTSIDEQDCLEWLKSKKPDSVIYICFGSTAHQIAPQLYEIAMALEASRQKFIWVVRNNGDGKGDEEWLPPGFEQRMEGKALIIRGWAPQVLILEHEAVGAFLTHCGWNSMLEGISAGVPMVTWPVFAEQFYNEKLLTQVLKTGIPVGAKKWARVPSLEDIVKRDAIEKALREIMLGDDTAERRSRAKKLKEMAWKAVEEGGSSYSDLSELIDKLRSYHA